VPLLTGWRDGIAGLDGGPDDWLAPVPRGRRVLAVAFRFPGPPRRTRID